MKMKKLNLIHLLFLPFFCFGQINEQFSNGNFTENPRWEGMVENFIVNDDFQLQSNAPSASQSFLFTPSRSINNAVWETWVRINFQPSGTNFASIYIISDRADISGGFNGYFVQIGGPRTGSGTATDRDISLFLQQGTRRTRIINGAINRVQMNPVEVNIRVTRDENGNFELFSRLASEDEFVLEGRAHNTAVTQTYFFGVLFSNTNTTGRNYFFDDIFVSGEPAVDLEPPVWNSVAMEEPNKLLLEFSKPIDIDNAEFWVDNGIGFSHTVRTLTGRTSVELEFSVNFLPGITYTLEINGLTDLSGNALIENKRTFGLPERIEFGDLLFNEVMFDNHENSVEYVELINTSDKVLDISGFVIATRRADETLTSGVRIPENTLILPRNYVAFASDARLVRAHHNAPPEANIVQTASWTNLNNESATLVLTDEMGNIFDELIYNRRWHHPLIRNPRGVALERISPFLPTQNPDSWHSASSETNFGTPGYRNSQFREIHAPASDNERFVWLDPEAFSPDGDGFNDVCFIRYKTNEAGYVANVAIFNASGVKVRQIASNELLATEGFFMWDGTTDRGQNANVGIYVLFFEKFHVESGRRRQAKLPLVVSAR